MMKWRFLVFTGWTCTLTVACQGGAIFKPFDVTEQSVSMDARQRVLLSVRHPPAGDGERLVICAEPSPDALAVAAQAIAAQAEVAGQGGAGFAASLNESAASIGLRTATIQLLRDGLYRACEAYLNGSLNNFGYALLLSKYDDIMKALIAIEGLTRIPPAPQVEIGATARSDATATNRPQASAGGQGGQTGESNSSRTGGIQSTVNSAGMVPTPTITNISTPTSDAAAMEKVAMAVMEIAEPDRPMSSVLGACLIWFSSAHQNPNEIYRDRLVKFCDDLLQVAILQARSGRF